MNTIEAIENTNNPLSTAAALRMDLRVLFAYRVKTIVGAQKHLAAASGRRCHEVAVQFVASDHFERAAGLDHDRLAALTHEVDLAVAGNRRCAEGATYTLLPQTLAVAGINRGQNPVVGAHVDHALIMHKR